MEVRMRVMCGVMLVLLSGGAAMAQSAPAGPSGEVPVDKGPNTPAANNAYQGGGVILQGAPGAPAPTPQATPAGQAPQNSVPAQ
jgi:hypothetical protein